MKADAILAYIGRRAVMQLSPKAGAGPVSTGKIVAVIPAADGLVVTVEPNGAAPEDRLTLHYHISRGSSRRSS